jgi:hypothetical protein
MICMAAEGRQDVARVATFDAWNATLARDARRRAKGLDQARPFQATKFESS